LRDEGKPMRSPFVAINAVSSCGRSMGRRRSDARVATFASTLDDIRNARDLGLIEPDGIARSLEAKIESAARGNAAQHLRSFLGDVEAQSGKHIAVPVAEILREDAHRLLRGSSE
jgi:hypothetical protein